MSAWPTAALGDLFEIARGGSPRPIANYLTDAAEGINWVSISDATKSTKVIKATKRRIKPEGVSRSRMVQAGDFLLTNSMSFGRPYIMGTSGCIHDGWLSLSPKSDRTDQDYLFQVLSSADIYQKFERLASGATVKNLNIDLVKGVQIPLPPLDEQRRIAAILDQADALRRKRDRSIKRLIALRHSIFMEMFGNPTTNDRLWPKRALSNLTAKIGSGATPTGGEAAYQATGVPLIRSMNVHDLRFKRDGLAFISPSQAASLDNVIVHTDDVLLNITGASVARVCRAPADLDGGRVNQHVAIIRPKGDLTAIFLEALLTQPSLKAELLKIGESGATRQAITKTQIQGLNVIVPSLHLQREFEERTKLIEILARDAVTQRSQLDALFSSLKYHAFRGEL